MSAKRFVGLVVFLGLAAMVLSSCAPAAKAGELKDGPGAEGAGSGVSSHGNEIGGYVDFIDALREAGATVEPAGELEQPFIDAEGYVIQVNGLDVQVFEFADEGAMQATAATISKDGSQVGTSMVTWIDEPNFWSKGRIIVLYVGQDAGMIELLTGVLGSSITE